MRWRLNFFELMSAHCASDGDISEICTSGNEMEHGVARPPTCLDGEARQGTVSFKIRNVRIQCRSSGWGRLFKGAVEVAEQPSMRTLAVNLERTKLMLALGRQLAIYKKLQTCGICMTPMSEMTKFAICGIKAVTPPKGCLRRHNFSQPNPISLLFLSPPI